MKLHTRSVVARLSLFVAFGCDVIGQEEQIGASQQNIDVGASPLAVSRDTRSTIPTLDWQDYCKAGGASGTDQKALDRFASSLDVQVTVVENGPAQCASSAPWGLCFNAKITLANEGAEFVQEGWSIYFSSTRTILSVDTDEFAVSHLKGDLHRIDPTPNFRGFRAYEVKEIPFQAEYCMTSRSDAMPRFYVAAPGLRPAIVANTNTEDLRAFVSALSEPKQALCGASDQTVLATAATRFAANASTRDLGPAAVAAEIVPSPLFRTAQRGWMDVSHGLSIRAPQLDAAALAAVHWELFQMGLPARNDATPVEVSIDPADAAFVGRSARQAYRMMIGAHSISVVGGDRAGALYGLRSLLALLSTAAGARANSLLPRIQISYDAPRYPYRGVSVDVARNFHSVSAIRKVLEQMARYKLNALRLHLSDDEGWRLQIPGLPELTDIGGRRCHDLDEHNCLLPQLGSGPFAMRPGSGYFTRDDFIGILRFASARGIQVVPEFDLPGHARAAIRAMAVRAANGDSSYNLSDPDDTSAYLSPQHYDDNVVNPCLLSSYTFVTKVMDEVLAMYADAGVALETWHAGNDEVPSGAWTKSPVCSALYDAAGDVGGVPDVLPHFISRVSAIAKERGINVFGSSDGMFKAVVDSNGATIWQPLEPDTYFAGNAPSVTWWSSLPWFDDAVGVLANRGYKIVLANANYLYLDQPYEADPDERGNGWATRSSDVHKLFTYISGNLAANSQLMPECEGGACSQVFAAATPIEKTENIIGLEAAIWSETVRTDEQLEYMMFPRLLALAERAWHRAEWEPADGMDPDAFIDTDRLHADWERFANALGYNELPRLDRASVRYRIEVPGARISDGRLEANIATPGLSIQYKSPKGVWVDYEPTNPPAVDQTEIRAVSSTGRVGRAVVVPKPSGA